MYDDYIGFESDFSVGDGVPVFEGEDIMERDDQRFFFGSATHMGGFDQPYQVDSPSDAHHYVSQPSMFMGWY